VPSGAGGWATRSGQRALPRRRLRDHGARAGKRVRGLRVLAATAVAAVEHQHRDTGHDEQPTEQLVGAALAFDRPRGAAPASPFNQALGPERVLGFGAVPLDRVLRVRATFGVTVSDIVMAARDLGPPRVARRPPGLPGDPLRAMVSVSVRTGDDAPTSGNVIALTTCALPVGEPDPVERLDECTGSWPTSSSRLRLADRVRLPVNLVVSNVPGPVEALFLAGRELLERYPVPTTSEGLGLSITVQGYRGVLQYGVVSAPRTSWTTTWTRWWRTCSTRTTKLAALAAIRR